MVTPSSPLTTIDWKNVERHMNRRNQRALARNCRQAGRHRRHPNPVWNLPLLPVCAADVTQLPLTAVDGRDASKLSGTVVLLIEFAMVVCNVVFSFLTM